ncbi:MAG: FliH/SctL family protein [Planctomycetaceae bacterium]
MISLNIPHRIDAVRVIPSDELENRARGATAVVPPPPDPLLRLPVLLESLHDVIQNFEERRQQSLSDLQRAAIELAIAATSHILGRVVEQNEFPIGELVDRAIAQVGTSSVCRVALHPDDLPLIQSRAELASTELDWIADATLPRGSCRAERDGGDGVLVELGQYLADIRYHWIEDLDDAPLERRQTPTDGQPLRRFPNRRETA